MPAAIGLNSNPRIKFPGMKKFLDEVAAALYREYGPKVSDLHLVFPGKRARLFFNQALVQLSDGKPLWQPRYLSIDHMVRELSDLELADHLRLVAELYTIYNEYHPEPFDRFYRWGEMLLSDFDTIDKYLIDARALYTNVSDLKDIEAQFSVLFEGNDESLKLVLSFWQAFNKRMAKSVEQQQFLRIWQSLYAIYDRFRARLRELRIAYAGMIYRDIAEQLEAGSLDARFGSQIYAFIGFNALNECEQRLFDYLNSRGNGRFYWDYDRYYFDSADQEAGRFIRRNVARFGDGDGQQAGLERDNFRQPKTVEVIATPSDIFQCKALYRELEHIYNRQGFVDKETAIVLTDENLLLPVLHSIPEQIEGLNVTMGYPLQLTMPYLLLERMLTLQKHQRDGAFAHEDVLNILQHPYIQEHFAGSARALEQKITDWQSLWVPQTFFAETEAGLARIFRFIPEPDGVEPLQNYLEEILSNFGAIASDSEDAKERKEFLFTILEYIRKLGHTIREGQIGDLSGGMYGSLLLQLIRQVRIPYEGEPLSGLQIMGILETRNLDFDNVILLSLTDDTFPGNLEGSSYVPFNLRQAFGLPTPQDHEAMYAYYFYRLIARCQRLVMLYSSSSDDQRTGEQSRYISQLEYESPHEVGRANVNLRVDYRPVEPIVVAKTSQILERLQRMEFYPSKINRSIDCPLKFYFTDIERLELPEELTAEATALDVGNTLHRTLELLYAPLLGKADWRNGLAALSQEQVQAAAEEAMADVMGIRGQQVRASGRMLLHRNIVIRYVRNILAYDMANPERFEVQQLEQTAKIPFRFDDRSVILAGIADRIDSRADGTLRIVDYKSGGDDPDFASIASLFTNEGVTRDGEVKYEPHNSAVLQTLLYGLVFARERQTEVSPALYVARKMGNVDYTPYPVYRNEMKEKVKLEVVGRDQEEELAAGLENLFRNLFDAEIPFTQTEHRRTCAFCDFRSICRR